MNILGIVPARGGSKRLPGKNKRLLAGKPLILWALESGLGSRLITKLVISSDDEEILSVASALSGIEVIHRPAEFSGDRAQPIEYVHHALACVEKDSKRPFDIVVIIQPTSPLTIPEDIDGTIELLMQSDADTAVSVVKLDHAIHPMKLKTMDGDKLLPYFEEENGRMAAFELPDIYIRNCSVYASKRRVIDENKIIGDDCRGYIMPRIRSVDINDEIDFYIAERLLGFK